MGRRDSIEAKRAYNRERYHRNREKILAQQKERYENNREKLISKQKEYYENNKDKIKARAAAHYRENADVVKLREANRRRDRKVYLVSLLGSKCFRCQANHPASLDFHHKDAATKVFSIADMMNATKQVREEDLIEEVMKCELLCKNCHAIEHCTWELDATVSNS
jgi:hypothetical protein